MGWFGGRLFKRGRSHRPGQGPETEERRGRKPSPSGTLVLLTPDAAGAACFRLNVFPDAGSAAEFLRTWYAGGVDRATAAFWAMHQEPAPIPSAPQAPAEAVVLVRDAARPGVVYAFSFAGMDEARSFARVEVVRGLELRQVMVYWSVSVKIEGDGRGNFRLEPSLPPPARRWPEPTRTHVVREGQTAGGEAGGAAVEPEVLQAAEEIVRQAQGREAAPAGGAPAAAAPAEPTPLEEAPPQTDEQELRDVFDELMRTLRSGWERPDGPFQGFGSPPGKF